MVPSHANKVESSFLTQFCQLGKYMEAPPGRGHYVPADLAETIRGAGAQPA
jgi:hypothetical protein